VQENADIVELSLVVLFAAIEPGLEELPIVKDPHDMEPLPEIVDVLLLAAKGLIKIAPVTVRVTDALTERVALAPLKVTDAQDALAVTVTV
jgi:hypothetical protein